MNLHELHQRAEAIHRGEDRFDEQAKLEMRNRRVEATMEEKRKWVESELRNYGFGDAVVNSILNSCEVLNRRNL